MYFFLWVLLVFSSPLAIGLWCAWVWFALCLSCLRVPKFLGSVSWCFYQIFEIYGHYFFLVLKHVPSSRLVLFLRCGLLGTPTKWLRYTVRLAWHSNVSWHFKTLWISGVGKFSPRTATLCQAKWYLSPHMCNQTLSQEPPVWIYRAPFPHRSLHISTLSLHFQQLCSFKPLFLW